MNISKDKLEDLYNENIKDIYKFFYYKTLNAQTAQDLTSETFLRFAEYLNKSDIENLRAFLYGIAKNVFTEYLKKKYKGQVYIEDTLLDFYSYSQEYQSVATKKTKLIDLITSLLPKLPKKQSMILKMRLVEKYSIKEICQKLNKSQAYVKTTQNRAIKSLKKLIEIDKFN